MNIDTDFTQFNNEDTELTAREAYALFCCLDQGKNGILTDINNLMGDLGEDEKFRLPQFDPDIDEEELEEEWVFADAMVTQFPRVADNQTVKWWRRMATAFNDLEDDLTAGKDCYPRSTAEQVALRFALIYYRDFVKGMHKGTTVNDVKWTDLPEDDEERSVYEIRELLVADEDIDMLWDDQYAGVEHPDNPGNLALNIGDLRAPAWFNWFARCESRRPEEEHQRSPALTEKQEYLRFLAQQSRAEAMQQFLDHATAQTFPKAESSSRSPEVQEFLDQATRRKQ